MSDGDRLPTTATIYRTSRPDFFPADQTFPDWRAFAPSDDEKADAIRLGRPVRVSAWDSRKTTANQARNFTRIPATALVCALTVTDVIATGEAFANDRVGVVEDQATAPDPTSLGAAGHVGIEGLDRPLGQPKATWKLMLDTLGARCVVLLSG